MKILVSGGNGFVGKRLVEKLLENKHSVTVFDKQAEKNGKINYIIGDISNPVDCEKVVKGNDCIIHLAALTDELAGKKALWDVNVNGTQNVVTACEKEKIKQFIYLSTVGVHAKVKGEVSEESEIKPETPYEESKAEAEKIVRESSLNFTIVRSALIYGPNDYWKKILKMVLKGFPLIGNGKNMFQLIFVDDLISAILFLLNHPKALKEIFIVSEKEKHELREVYEMMGELMQITPKKKFLPYWQGMLLAQFSQIHSKLTGKKSILLPTHVKRLVHERNYSTNKIQSLGWQPKTTTRNGFEQTIKYLKEKNEL